MVVQDGVGDDVVFGRIVLVLVDAEHDGDVFILRRSRDDDLLDGAAQMLFGIVRVGETAGRFHHNLNAQRLPVQQRRVLLREDLYLLAVDDNGVAFGLNVGFKIAEDRVVLEKVGQSLRAGEIVYGDDIDVRIVKRCAENIAANTAKAIDTNFNRHSCLQALADAEARIDGAVPPALFAAEGNASTAFFAEQTVSGHEAYFPQAYGVSALGTRCFRVQGRGVAGHGCGELCARIASRVSQAMGGNHDQ